MDQNLSQSHGFQAEPSQDITGVGSMGTFDTGYHPCKRRESNARFVLEDTALRAVACLEEGRNRLNVVETVYRRRLGNFFVHVIFVQQNHTFGEVRAGFASF